MLACAKHYVGDGGTTFGTGIPTRRSRAATTRSIRATRSCREADLRRIHLPGYIDGDQRRASASIMPSYSSWNGVKCSGNKHLLTDILKEELGFEGFLISDYNAIDQMPGDVSAQIEQSINAGMDMVMVPERYMRVHRRR